MTTPMTIPTPTVQHDLHNTQMFSERDSYLDFTLNPFAHYANVLGMPESPGAGLPGALAIIESVPSYIATSTGISTTFTSKSGNKISK